MLTLLAVLGVLAIFFVAAAVATREGEVLLDAPADAADLRLPAGPLQPEDVATVRFGLALRGYRMTEVDEVLDRVQAELAERDARIRELEAELGGAEVVTPPGEERGHDEVTARTATGVLAPSAALLAPVLTQQTVPGPVEEPVDADGGSDDDTGWAFDDGGAARSAARLSSAALSDPDADDWGMPQVLDLEPAEPGIADAVETPDPVDLRVDLRDDVRDDDGVHDAEPVEPRSPGEGEPTEPPAATAPPAWGGSVTSPPVALPPQPAGAAPEVGAPVLSEAEAGVTEIETARPDPDPFGPDEPWRPTESLSPEPLSPPDPLSPQPLSPPDPLSPEPLSPPDPLAPQPLSPQDPSPAPSPGPAIDPLTAGPHPVTPAQPYDAERPDSRDGDEQAGPSYS